MFKFLVRLSVFAAIIAVVLLILGFVDIFREVMVFTWICYAFFLSLSIITYFFSMRTMEKKLSSFMNVYFVGIFSKLILSAILVLIFKMTHDTSGLNYIIPFAIVYFSFLIFETVELAQLSRKAGNPKVTDKNAK